MYSEHSMCYLFISNLLSYSLAPTFTFTSLVHPPPPSTPDVERIFHFNPALDTTCCPNRQHATPSHYLVLRIAEYLTLWLYCSIYFCICSVYVLKPLILSSMNDYQSSCVCVPLTACVVRKALSHRFPVYPTASFQHPTTETFCPSYHLHRSHRRGRRKSLQALRSYPCP
jgi:hypothetical protein